MNGLEKFLASGFYFSVEYDLSSSIYKQQAGKVDSRYVWNTNILKDFEF